MVGFALLEAFNNFVMQALVNGGNLVCISYDEVEVSAAYGAAFAFGGAGMVRLTKQLERALELARVAKSGANFANKSKLSDHFEKPGVEFGAGSADEYWSIAQDVMKQGAKVKYSYKSEARAGYVQLVGTTRNGQSKYAFVGTNGQGIITTLRRKSGKDFWKTLDGIAADRTIYPAQ